MYRITWYGMVCHSVGSCGMVCYLVLCGAVRQGKV